MAGMFAQALRGVSGHPTSPHQHAHGHVGVSWAGGQVGDETVLQARELHTSLREHCSGARRSKGEAAAMVDGTDLRASGEGHGHRVAALDAACNPMAAL